MEYSEIFKNVLKGVENLKEDKTETNLVKANFLINNYNKLSEDQKNSLSERASDFLHFIESFALYENQKLVHLWLLESPIQDINTNTCGPFKTYFYENLFFLNSDSILHERKRLTYDAVQECLKEIFTTNTDQNKKTINAYIKQKNIKIANQ